MFTQRLTSGNHLLLLSAAEQHDLKASVFHHRPWLTINPFSLSLHKLPDENG